MAYSVAPLENLIDSFARLPGIGRKSAQRLAYYMLNQSEEECSKFAETIVDAKKKIRCCTECQNLTDSELCPICDSETRDKSVICVVEEPKDVIALERTREYSGLYHVLHGVISPLAGISPEDIKIKELLKRIGKGGVSEVIMATNASVEGEATAIYISQLLKPMSVKCTRLAYGLPVGGDLEYADEVTLSRAIEGRCEI